MSGNSEIKIDLFEWQPTPEEEFFEWISTPDYAYVHAKYEELFQLDNDTAFSVFDIKRDHYKKVMADVVKHINYFLNFYDTEHKLFTAIMSIKFIIDQNNKLKVSTIKRLILERIITDEFLDKITEMANDLYVINIDNSSGTSYANTPKITNDQAKQLVILSFCYRMIIPLCMHFVHHNVNFVGKKDYIPFLDKLYMTILKKVEKRGIPFFYSVCRFIMYRCERQYNANRGTWMQKKQLYGIVVELYEEELIHEVVLVKSLHKLNYNLSVVSFIDGVLFRHALNFRRENFKSKPYELDVTETQSDGDDYLSHAEALEMAVYQIDESNAIINEVNIKMVMQLIRNKFPFHIRQKEYDFYYGNVKPNEISQMLLHDFFSKYFDCADSIYLISLDETITLMLLAKKYLQLKGLSVIPQLYTALIQGKYKDNPIKNTKFIEKITSSDVWKSIIVPKYRYIKELEGNYDSLLRKYSIIVNATFTVVDFDPEIDGMSCSNIDVDLLVDEVSFFLSII